MIRTEEHFVWNFTGMMGFLAVGFFLGILSLLVPHTILWAFTAAFIHNGVRHISFNLLMMMVIGLGLSAFAHPVEFGGILISAMVVNTITYFFFPGVGLSLVVYVMVAAFIIYLCGVVFELDHFGIIGKVALPVTGVLLLTVVLFLVSDQLLHDYAVVFEGQAVQYDNPHYTRGSSLAHVTGFLSGGVAAVGLRYIRYRILEIP